MEKLTSTTAIAKADYNSGMNVRTEQIQIGAWEVFEGNHDVPSGVVLLYSDNIFKAFVGSNRIPVYPYGFSSLQIAAQAIITESKALPPEK